MLANFSIRTKIFFLVTSVIVVSFVILTTIVSYRAFERAKRDVFNLAHETGRYAPYWNKLGENIEVEPLPVIDAIADGFRERNGSPLFYPKYHAIY